MMSQTASAAAAVASEENLSENLYLTYSNNQLNDPSLSSLNLNKSSTKNFGKDDNNNNASKRVLLGKRRRFLSPPIFSDNLLQEAARFRLPC